MTQVALRSGVHSKRILVHGSTFRTSTSVSKSSSGIQFGVRIYVKGNIAVYHHMMRYISFSWITYDNRSNLSLNLSVMQKHLENGVCFRRSVWSRPQYTCAPSVSARQLREFSHSYCLTLNPMITWPDLGSKVSTNVTQTEKTAVGLF